MNLLFNDRAKWDELLEGSGEITEYLVDAVMIQPLDSEDLATQPVWESLWASLTFHTP